MYSVELQNVFFTLFLSWSSLFSQINNGLQKHNLMRFVWWFTLKYATLMVNTSSKCPHHNHRCDYRWTLIVLWDSIQQCQWLGVETQHSITFMRSTIRWISSTFNNRNAVYYLSLYWWCQFGLKWMLMWICWICWIFGYHTDRKSFDDNSVLQA